MRNDEWILIRKPGTRITHTYRGVLNEEEFQKFYSPIPVVFFACRRYGCGYADYFLLDDYLQNIILECPKCNSYHVVAEWLEEGDMIHQTYYHVIPAYTIVTDFSNNYDIVTASDQHMHFGPQNMFDQNTSTLWVSKSTGEVHEIVWKGNVPIQLDNFRLKEKTGSPFPATQGCPTDYNIYGSDDGINWEILMNITNDPSSGGIYHHIPNPKNYLYYKIADFIGDDFIVHEAFQNQYTTLTSSTTDTSFHFSNVHNIANNNDNSQPWIGEDHDARIHEIIFYFDVPRKLQQFYLTPGNVSGILDPISLLPLINHCPIRYDIYGSDDGITYNLLFRTTNDPPNGNKINNILAQEYYHYYKISNFSSRGNDMIIDQNGADVPTIHENKLNGISISPFPTNNRVLNNDYYNNPTYTCQMISNTNGTSSILYDLKEDYYIYDISLRSALHNLFESSSIKSFTIKLSKDNINWDIFHYNNSHDTYKPFQATDAGFVYSYHNTNINNNEKYRYILIDNIQGHERYINFAPTFSSLTSNSSNNISNAFDINTSNFWEGDGNNNWIICYFSFPTLLKNFYLRDITHLYGANSTSEINIFGSQDQEYWHPLLKIDNLEDKEYEIDNNTFFRFYKIEMISTYTPRITCIRLMEDSLEYSPTSIIGSKLSLGKEVKSRVSIGELNLMGETTVFDRLGIAHWEMNSFTHVPEQTVEEFIEFTDNYYKFTYHKHLQREE